MHFEGTLFNGNLSLWLGLQRAGVGKTRVGHKTAKRIPMDPATAAGVEQTGDSSVVFSDDDLVARARENDPWATDQLVRRYQKKAYAIAYRMTSGDGEEARDLTQEAFLRVFRNIRKFKGKASFYTWLYRIVVNTCLDARRKHTRWRRLFSFWQPEDRDGRRARNALEDQPDLAENTDPVAAMSGKQLNREVQDVLSSLPEKQRTAFELKVFQEMRIHEIADVMGSAEGTVKSHLFRATQTLRAALKEWSERR